MCFHKVSQKGVSGNKEKFMKYFVLYDVITITVHYINFNSIVIRPQIQICLVCVLYNKKFFRKGWVRLAESNIFSKHTE